MLAGCTGGIRTARHRLPPMPEKPAAGYFSSTAVAYVWSQDRGKESGKTRKEGEIRKRVTRVGEREQRAT